MIPKAIHQFHSGSAFGDAVTNGMLYTKTILNELGFEHLASFSKLFKTKTNLSPLEFRQSFN